MNGFAAAVVHVLVVVVALLAFLVLLEALVLVEMVKQVAQLRARADLDDEPEPLLLGTATAQPFPRPDLVNGSSLSALVFLSTHCATCEEIAAAVPAIAEDAAPDVRVIPIVEGHGQAEIDDFIAKARLGRELVVVDPHHDLGKELGLQVRPAAVIVRQGLVAEAAAIRNPRQLSQFLERLPGDNGSSSSSRTGQRDQVISSPI